ncbi:hypothetical protein C8A05DRAFT_35218, partial [Staphylotrichum tortipilum]
MDKPNRHPTTGSLQANGPLSPPLTPSPGATTALHNNSNNNNAIGITNNVAHPTTRPASPAPSLSSASIPSTTSCPSPRPTSSTFTGTTSFSDSQPPLL